MKSLLVDIGYGYRLYRRTPTESVIAVASLAIAMTFVGTFFTSFVELALKPHAGFSESGQLLTIGQSDGATFAYLSPALIERINDEVLSVDAVAGITARALEVGWNREQRLVELVSSGFFSGVRPRLASGRGFELSDHAIDSEPVAIISYQYWLEQYDGDENVLGRSVMITGRPLAAPAPNSSTDVTTEFRIVGVAARELPSVVAPRTAVWLPFERVSELYMAPSNILRRSRVLIGVARLAEDATLAAVANELNQRYGDDDDANIVPGFRLHVISGVVADINVQRNIVRHVGLLVVASVLLAVVAACNVSLFFLTRAPRRHIELGIRRAVGAPLRRLDRQLITEAGMLVLVAVSLGALLSILLGSYLRTLALIEPTEAPDLSTLLNWRTLLPIVGFVSLLTCIVCLPPIWGLRKLGIATSNRMVTARATLTQRLASTVQFAIAGAVGGAALGFGWYLMSLLTANAGYALEGIHSVEFTTAAAGQTVDTSLLAAIVDRDRRREAILSIPGVTAVAFASSVPGQRDRGFSISRPRFGSSNDQFIFSGVTADSQYFETLNLRFTGGRNFAPNETSGAIINETLARSLWGHTNATGETLPFSFYGEGGIEVIGVVADVAYQHPSANVLPRAYFPVLPNSIRVSILVESSLSTADLQVQMQGLIDSGDLDISVVNVRTLRELRHALIVTDRARSLMTVIAAVLVVFTAALGFYGTQYCLVTAGQREYAIRASLGAGPRALGILVLTRGLSLGVPGLLLGGVLSFIVVAWLRDSFNMREISPSIITTTILTILVILLLVASLRPARIARATRPDPLLREA